MRARLLTLVEQPTLVDAGEREHRTTIGPCFVSAFGRLLVFVKLLVLIVGSIPLVFCQADLLEKTSRRRHSSDGNYRETVVHEMCEVVF